MQVLNLLAVLYCWISLSGLVISKQIINPRSNDLEFSELNGIIVIFKTENEAVNDELLELRKQYKKFIKTELENKIGKEFDTLFIGFTIKLNNKGALYYKVGNYLGVNDLREDDDQIIFDGLQKLLTDFKKQELEELGVTLDLLPDSSVSIFDVSKIK